MKKIKLTTRIIRWPFYTRIGSIATIIAIAGILVILSLIGQDEVSKIQAFKALAYMNQDKIGMIKDVQEENQALKAKLDRSSKMQVKEQVKELSRFYIRKYFGKDAAIAEKVFTCESGLSNQAININKGIHAGSADRGIAQINDKFHKKRFEKMYGVKFEIGAHDYDLNIRYAKFLHDHSGFSPWVCSRITGVLAAK